MIEIFIFVFMVVWTFSMIYFGFLIGQREARENFYKERHK